MLALTLCNCVYACAAQATLDDSYTNNGLNQVTAVDATAITYDGRGNITGDGTTSWSFDASNRLITSGSSTFAYDPAGRLERVTTGSAAQGFLYAGGAGDRGL